MSSRARLSASFVVSMREDRRKLQPAIWNAQKEGSCCCSFCVRIFTHTREAGKNIDPVMLLAAARTYMDMMQMKGRGLWGAENW